MKSITQHKNAIVDLLWDWTTNLGKWSELLINKIVTTELPLNQEEREEIFNHFLQSIGLRTGLPELTIQKPTYSPTSKKLRLDSISKVSGINRLATDQVLNFSENITVIYGENGTGKTGYSRILKSLGFSYDTGKEILPNIYTESKKQGAAISYSLNNTPYIHEWDGKHRKPELENISVFDGKCVEYSIADRRLIVTPSGFHLFQLVTDELNNLSNLLTNKINALSIELKWSENLTERTPQFNFIKTLSSKSPMEELKKLSVFNEEHQEELQLNLSELEKLNKPLLEIEIQNLSRKIAELEFILNKLKEDQKILSLDKLDYFKYLNSNINYLECKTQTGIKDIAKERGIEFYQSVEFHLFLQTAEAYIKLLGNQEYPENEDNCIYCLQPLSKSAKDLLGSYRKILNDKTQEKLIELKKEKAEFNAEISKIEFKIQLQQPTFGIDEKQTIIHPKEVLDYNNFVEKFKLSLLKNEMESDFNPAFNMQPLLTTLESKLSIEKDLYIQKKMTLDNLNSEETKLRSAIEELMDRKLLSEKQTDVLEAISNLKEIEVLKANSGDFNTSAISRKTTTAREELVTKNFEEIFRNELKALRKDNIKIEIKFGTEKGNSKLFQKISKHDLVDILSEGEQKAISLAEFLTELQLDNFTAPVVFDDPINSLDHKITDEVVKRLIQLSKSHQVIIFTHSILLLHSFLQQAELDQNKQEGIKFQFHRVKENFGITGIIDEIEELNSYSYYTSKLNLILENKNTSADEARLAAEGYGYLRSAIEVFLEEDLFQRTIKRYKKGIAFPSLMRVKGIKIDQNKSKLNDIYEKCCVSIVGHSSPEEIHTTPTISELKSDFGEFRKIRAEFTGKEK
ncbi:AAA family ATPase [Leptospira sp. WS60.C2]